MQKKTLIITLIILMNVALYSDEKRELVLTEIAGNIAKYRSKTITMKLKLKHVDLNFEKIIFYDAMNYDIEFDISSKKIKKSIRKDLLNLHEGMDYLVTFVVHNVGNLGELTGEIKRFTPAIINNLP